MKALVTGISGFTGPYLAKALNKHGISVVGLAHAGAEVANVHHIHVADITDRDTVREIVLAERPDFVAHLAAISSVVHGDVEEIYRTNILGTRNMLDALAALPATPQCVLIASSSNIYGNRNEGMIREDTTPDPVNDYAVSKLSAELIAGLYKSRLRICVARPFNYTGVGQSPAFLIPKIVQHFRSGQSTIRLGNLEVARDFSDVRFVVEAYARLLQCPEAAGRTMNVSSGRSYRLDEVLNKMEQITGRQLNIVIDPQLVRDNEVRSLWGDSSLLDQLIGPIERIPLEETLRWMIEA